MYPSILWKNMKSKTNKQTKKKPTTKNKELKVLTWPTNSLDPHAIYPLSDAAQQVQSMEPIPQVCSIMAIHIEITDKSIKHRLPVQKPGMAFDAPFQWLHSSALHIHLRSLRSPVQCCEETQIPVGLCHEGQPAQKEIHPNSTSGVTHCSDSSWIREQMKAAFFKFNSPFSTC